MSTAAQLDSTDEALVAALASGLNVSRAAGQLGIAPSTAYRRASQPAFRAALAEARGDRWRPSGLSRTPDSDIARQVPHQDRVTIIPRLDFRTRRLQARGVP